MQNTTVQHFDVAIVGTGFSGLGMGVALKKAKKNNFVILEKAIDVGGTWRLCLAQPASVRWAGL